MNKLIRAIKKRDNVNTEEAECMCIEEFEICGMNAEDTLYNLGFELDYVFDLIDIIEKN